MAAGATIATAFGAVVGGVMLANVLRHPEGTKQAADGVVNILRPTYNALLGEPS